MKFTGLREEEKRVKPMSTPEWIKKIQERHNEMPEGPYAYEYVSSDDNTCCVGVVLDDDHQPIAGSIASGDGILDETIAGEVPNGEYAKFIAASWADTAALLQHCLKLREAVEALKTAKAEKAEHGDNPVYQSLKKNAWKLIDEALIHKPEGLNQ